MKFTHRISFSENRISTYHALMDIQTWTMTPKDKGRLSAELLAGIVLFFGMGAYLILSPIIHGMWILLLSTLLGLGTMWVGLNLLKPYMNALGSTTELKVSEAGFEVNQIRTGGLAVGGRGFYKWDEVSNVGMVTVGTGHSGRIGWELVVVTRSHQVVMIAACRHYENPLVQEVMQAMRVHFERNGSPGND